MDDPVSMFLWSDEDLTAIIRHLGAEEHASRKTEKSFNELVGVLDARGDLSATDRERRRKLAETARNARATANDWERKRKDWERLREQAR